MEELDGGNGPEVDRAEGVLLDPSPEAADDRPLVLGMPVEGVPTDEILLWPLAVSAPVLIEVNIGTEDEFVPVVGAVVMLVSVPVATTDEILLDVPDDNGGGFASELVSETDNVDDGTVRLPLKLVVATEDEVLLGIFVEDRDGETKLRLAVVTSLAMLVDGDAVSVLLEPNPVPGTDSTVPFDPGTPVVRVVPVMVVGGCVPTVVCVIVVSMAVVNVLPRRVVGGIVNVSVVDVISVFVLPELNGELGKADRSVVRVEFVTGYGAELEGRTDMAEELPLALVRLAPEEDTEVRGVPEEVDDSPVTPDVIDPPLVTKVGLVR